MLCYVWWGFLQDSFGVERDNVYSDGQTHYGQTSHKLKIGKKLNCCFHGNFNAWNMATVPISYDMHPESHIFHIYPSPQADLSYYWPLLQMPMSFSCCSSSSFWSMMSSTFLTLHNVTVLHTYWLPDPSAKSLYNFASAHADATRITINTSAIYLYLLVYKLHLGKNSSPKSVW